MSAALLQWCVGSPDIFLYSYPPTSENISVKIGHLKHSKFFVALSLLVEVNYFES